MLLKGFHKHHIIPRYLGGEDSDDNLVDLHPIDHAIWHLVRYKMFGNIGDLRSANLLMGKIDGSKFGDDRSGERNPNFGNHWTQEMKDRMSKIKTGYKMDPAVVAKVTAKNRGQKRPIQSLKMSGINNPNFGKPMSDETRAKLSASQKARLAAIKQQKEAQNVGC